MQSKPVDVALTAGALLGLACIVAALAAVLFGITPLVFRSGSMAPAIPTGSLAIGQNVPASDVRVGDVISVERLDGSRITHRVDSVDSLVGNSATLTLKGDANSVADAEPYTITSAVEVIAHVPLAGYFVAWLSTPYAWVIGALLSGSLIWVAFGPRTRPGDSTHTDSRPRSSAPRHAQHAKSGRSSVVTSVVVVTLVAGVVGVGFSRADMTEAAITDIAYGSAPLAAGNLPGPSTFTCANRSTGILSSTVDLSFPNVNQLYTYTLTFTGGLLGSPDPITINPSTAVTITRSPGASLITAGTTTVSLVARLNGFTSAPALTRQFTSLLGSATCSPQGTASAPAPAAPRAARLAAPTEEATTAGSPSVDSTSTTPSTTATSTTAASAATTTPPPLTTTTPPLTTTTTTIPPTTTTTTTPVTAAPTTRPPPPATAFIADGGSASSGNFTASIASNRLSITGTDGATVFEGPVTSSPRYGTGAVWSTDGNLYLLSEGRDPVRVGPSTDGPFVSTAVPTSQLPADIAALL